MKVEIWSDVVCPFCYIGKVKFDEALEQFPYKDKLDISWKSFQLMPELETQPGKSIDQVLAETKGISLAQAKQMNASVTQMAKQVGLTYQFDKAVVANTIKAHQFAHFAKTAGKQIEAETLLFRSYFTDGKNVDDIATLVELGAEIGLDTIALKASLENEKYAADVQNDIAEARQLGVRGVPFFVFDRKYAVSGAQDPTVFLQALDQSFAEWQKANPAESLQVVEGAVCEPGGNCD